MHIRKAQKRDIVPLLEIYNFEALNGTATFDLNPKSVEEWTRWYNNHNVGNHPLIVADVDGVAVGYASLSGYREKEAYKSTVELSVYVNRDYRGQGIGTELMQAILDMARKDESIHTVVSVITSDNQDSVHLHEKLGFTYCGTIHEVGRKFGRYLSISNFELQV
ncbi:MAG: N-acetyltransferase [Clostridia bacterium]|nr:N-acetyltransferase [Clostridia bacterium]